jgi:hypothetical protein
LLFLLLLLLATLPVLPLSAFSGLLLLFLLLLLLLLLGVAFFLFFFLTSLSSCSSSSTSTLLMVPFFVGVIVEVLLLLSEFLRSRPASMPVLAVLPLLLDLRRSNFSFNSCSFLSVVVAVVGDPPVVAPDASTSVCPCPPDDGANTSFAAVVVMTVVLDVSVSPMVSVLLSLSPLIYQRLYV